MKKDPSGYWKGLGMKVGDLPGHPFRGNQYTSGEGGGSSSAASTDSDTGTGGGGPSRNGIPESAVHDAIRTILSDRANYSGSLNYAVNYARAAEGMTGRELVTQVLYLLNNLSSWRHPDAAAVRQTLRTFSKPEKKR